MRMLEIIREVGRSGVEWGKEWETTPGYLTVQINRATWREILRLTPHGHAAGTLAGKHIDECAKCGLDIRLDVHSSTRAFEPKHTLEDNAAFLVGRIKAAQDILAANATPDAEIDGDELLSDLMGVLDEEEIIMRVTETLGQAA